MDYIERVPVLLSTCVKRRRVFACKGSEAPPKRLSSWKRGHPGANVLKATIGATAIWRMFVVCQEKVCRSPNGFVRDGNERERESKEGGGGGVGSRETSSEPYGEVECAILTTRLIYISLLQSVTGVWNVAKKKGSCLLQHRTILGAAGLFSGKRSVKKERMTCSLCFPPRWLSLTLCVKAKSKC